MELTLAEQENEVQNPRSAEIEMDHINSVLSQITPDSFLILDEFGIHMDSKVKRNLIERLVEECTSKGCILVMTTHEKYEDFLPCMRSSKTKYAQMTSKPSEGIFKVEMNPTLPVISGLQIAKNVCQSSRLQKILDGETIEKYPDI